MQKNKEEVNITVLAQANSEIARSTLADVPRMNATGGGFSATKEFGEDGFKFYNGIPVDKSVSPILVSTIFVKGRFIVQISCRNCESEEPFKRFADYVLTALDGR